MLKLDGATAISVSLESVSAANSRDHLKMPQRLLNGLLLLRRAFRHIVSLRFGFVVAFALDNPMLGLHLGDVQAGDFKTGMLQHIILDLLIRCFALGGCHVHVIQVKRHVYIVVRFLLGQRKDRLDE